MRAPLFQFILILSALLPGSPLHAADPAAAVRETLRRGAFSAPLRTDLRFDVMDVSYLWPKLVVQTALLDDPPTLEETPEAAGSLPALDPTDSSRDLVPSRRLFAQMQSFLNPAAEHSTPVRVINPLTGRREGTQTPTDSLSNTSLADYNVVSFRVDDCGPSSRGQSPAQQILRTDAKGTVESVWQRSVCVPQLRLVLAADYTDVALHFIYSFVESPATFLADFPLNRERPDLQILAALTHDLLYLKSFSPATTDGKPLGAHPGLKSGDAAFRAKVKEFLRFYARKEYLSEIAVLSTNAFDGGREWAFTSFAVSAREPEKLIPNPILALTHTPLNEGFSDGAVLRPDGTDDRPFFDPRRGLVDSVHAHLDTILTVMDPRRTSTQNLDCASCHFESRALAFLTLSNAKALTGFAQLKWDLPVFNGITGFVDPAYLRKAASDEPGFETNFRAFGYSGRDASVSQRAAFESAQVAASLNSRLFGDEAGHGRSCRRHAVELVQCIFQQAENTNSDCFERFCD